MSKTTFTKYTELMTMTILCRVVRNARKTCYFIFIRCRECKINLDDCHII